jgi:hypothetical protein
MLPTLLYPKNAGNASTAPVVTNNQNLLVYTLSDTPEGNRSTLESRSSLPSVSTLSLCILSLRPISLRSVHLPSLLKNPRPKSHYIRLLQLCAVFGYPIILLQNM